MASMILQILVFISGIISTHLILELFIKVCILCDQWKPNSDMTYLCNQWLLKMGNSQASNATSVREMSDKDLGRMIKQDDEYA